MGVPTDASRVDDVIDLIYSGVGENEFFGELFGRRRVVPCAGGALFPIDPSSFELGAGSSFGVPPDDLRLYLDRYAPLDPFVQRPLIVQQLNVPARLSDLASPDELAHCEFSEFMRRVAYDDALAVVCAVNGRPRALLSIYRRQGDPEFSEGHGELLRRLAPHVARAGELRALAADPDGVGDCGAMLCDAAGDAAFVSAGARRIIDGVAADGVTPGETGGFVFTRTGIYRRTLSPVGFGSLIAGFAHKAFSAADAAGPWPALDDDLASCLAARRQMTVVALQPVRRRRDLDKRLDHYRLSPREKDVVMAAIQGLGNKEIKARLNLHEQTVKDYLERACKKMGIHCRYELAPRLFGFDIYVTARSAPSRQRQQQPA